MKVMREAVYSSFHFWVHFQVCGEAEDICRARWERLEWWTDRTVELIVADALLLRDIASLTFSGSREIFPMSWFLITIQEAYL